jgi:hypothetical protein
MDDIQHPHRGIMLVPCVAMLLTLFSGSTARAQVRTSPSSSQDEMTVTGAVVSSSRNTLVVKDNGGRYWLFVFDRNTNKPATFTNGSDVRVDSSPTDDPNVRLATGIEPAGRNQGAASRAADSGAISPAASTASPVVPVEVRRLEGQIERDARRYQVGVRAGMGLDPELALIGVQTQIGPFFNSDVYLRPNVDFGFGEVTAMFGLNLEAVYRLPVNSRQGRWSAYFGAGPGFNFVHQNFDRTSGGSRIDFGAFHSDTGLNILGGVRFRAGTFMELKTSVYTQTTPTLRLLVGYNF